MAFSDKNNNYGSLNYLNNYHLNDCPWILTKNTYNKNGTLIYDISYNPNRILTFKITSELDKNEWLMKLSKDGRCEDEIAIINNLRFEECPFSIKFPKYDFYKTGKLDKYKWYVIEKYDGVIRHDLIYCSSQLKNMGYQIISFLEWLHVSKGKAHGDLKTDNIVFKKKDTSFRIIDFESVTDPSNELCYESLPNGYYYYGLGCEYDKPPFSFRMDLQSFGYLLWGLSLHGSDFNGFRWQKQAFELYQKRKISNYFSGLDIEKKYNNLEIEKPEIIEKYFSIIEYAGWFDKKANPKVYTNLKELFA
jgi:serine/threonine protein kinase